ncbi:MAG: cytidylyltransferase domain-containing protein [Bacteroidales bacterium]
MDDMVANSLINKKMNQPYFIIETANTHGGDFEYLKRLVKSFEQNTGNFGIKFQAFHYDGISLPDFSFYETYKNLHFSKKQWSEIVVLAKKTKDVWLDVFDTFGIEILEENYEHIHGIKFQSSVLHNYEVLYALKKVGLKGKKIILNVAAQQLGVIEDIVKRVNEQLTPDEVLLEFGYQAYPTSLEDSGLCKIETIRKKFTNRLVFADHVDGNSNDAITLPLVAFTRGVDVIEKHVMLTSPEAKYDHFSSVTPERFQLMADQISRYAKLFDMPFINEKEEEYLQKTNMIPVLNKPKNAGSVINLKEDFNYRRTSQEGLTLDEIKAIQSDLKVLAKDKNPGETIDQKDFRAARIGSIVACRMKSSRLKQKALEDLNGITAVELCLKNTLKIKNIDKVTLATSYLEEDSVLKEYCYDPSVGFYQGDPLDVVQRFIDVAEKENLDIVVRQTADNVFMSEEILHPLLTSHFEVGADYTSAREAALGTNFEIINLGALKLVKEHFPKADYSEYMTWYFVNNPDYFCINLVDLPENLVRSYRLTLDYPEDLEMFVKVLQMVPNGNDATLTEIFGFLDNHPEVAKINSQMTVKYKSDPSLIEKLNRITKIPTTTNS